MKKTLRVLLAVVLACTIPLTTAFATGTTGGSTTGTPTTGSSTTGGSTTGGSTTGGNTTGSTTTGDPTTGGNTTGGNTTGSTTTGDPTTGTPTTGGSTTGTPTTGGSTTGTPTTGGSTTGTPTTGGSTTGTPTTGGSTTGTPTTGGSTTGTPTTGGSTTGTPTTGGSTTGDTPTVDAVSMGMDVTPNEGLKAGDLVTVAVHVPSIPMCGLSFKILYDAEVFEYVSADPWADDAELVAMAKAGWWTPTIVSNPGRLGYAAASAADVTPDATWSILVLTLKVKETAPDVETIISMDDVVMKTFGTEDSSSDVAVESAEPIVLNVNSTTGGSTTGGSTTGGSTTGGSTTGGSTTGGSTTGGSTTGGSTTGGSTTGGSTTGGSTTGGSTTGGSTTGGSTTGGSTTGGSTTGGSTTGGSTTGGSTTGGSTTGPIEPTHIHELTEVAEVPATCTEPGVKAYWVCSGEEGCNKYFADAEAKTEIVDLESWKAGDGMIPAHGLIYHEATAPTYSEAGNEAYYSCPVCGKYFADAEGTEEIEEYSWIIPRLTPPVDPDDPEPPVDPQPPVEPINFEDVPEDVFYTDAVQWAVEKGITNGTSATTFSPDLICNRAQAVTFLWRVAGSPEPNTKTSPFVDVEMNSFYGKAVLWATEKGITIGTSATTFSPNAPCIREQMVTLLCRMVDGKAAGTSIIFTDVIADAYYAAAVQWAVENGITNGTSATTFSPVDPCNRAQMVTFLYRCFAE